MAPFNTTLVKAFDMTEQELAVLLIANLALTIRHASLSECSSTKRIKESLFESAGDFEHTLFRLRSSHFLLAITDSKAASGCC